jgi:hypothetical protein
MPEPQAKFDLIKELQDQVIAHRTAHPSAGIVAVTLTENTMVIGLTEGVGNITVASQFHVAL